MHFVHSSTFYKCLDEVMRAIDERFRIKFPYNDEASLSSIASCFTRNGQSPITECVEAVDGVAVRIKEPALNNVLNPSTYFNRKGFFSINVQALCDSQYRFLFLSSSSAGSTQDSTAFALMRFPSLLEGSEDSLPMMPIPAQTKFLLPVQGRIYQFGKMLSFSGSQVQGSTRNKPLESSKWDGVFYRDHSSSHSKKLLWSLAVA